MYKAKETSSLVNKPRQCCVEQCSRGVQSYCTTYPLNCDEQVPRVTQIFCVNMLCMFSMPCMPLVHISVAMLPIWPESALFTARIKLYILTSYFRSFLYEAWYDRVSVITLSNSPFCRLGGTSNISHWCRDQDLRKEIPDDTNVPYPVRCHSRFLVI